MAERLLQTGRFEAFSLNRWMEDNRRFIKDQCFNKILNMQSPDPQTRRLMEDMADLI